MNWTMNEVKELVNGGLKRCVELLDERKYDDAEVILKQVLRVDTDNTNALKMLGLIKQQKGEFKKGEEYLEKAYEADTLDTQTLNNLALCYSNQGKITLARECLERAIEIKPDVSHYHNNLAIQYRHQGKLPAAKTRLQWSIDNVDDKNPLSWALLGGVHGQMKELDEAINCLNAALSFPEEDWKDLPGSREAANVDIFYALSLQGKFNEAWKWYEHRFECFEQIQMWSRLYGRKKQWDGTQDIKGKRILLYTEQGVGDAIHFARYIPYVKKEGAHVILHCSIELKSLLAPLVDETFILNPESVTEDKLPEYDYQSSLMSLPYNFQNYTNDDRAVPSITAPYLKVNKKATIENYPNCIKIGIAWAGSPMHPSDGERSCYLKEFQPLHDLPGVKLFSLQKDTRKRVRRHNDAEIDYSYGCENMNIIDMAEHLTDFEATAAIVNELDLIITVDTSLLHLAGAIGKETWAMIPWNPDWRWKIKGDTTEWYDSVRLFRQEEHSMGWKQPIQDICETLKKEKLCQQ
jgi:tetratricopeptide (TPR) repeat protein